MTQEDRKEIAKMITIALLEYKAKYQGFRNRRVVDSATDMYAAVNKQDLDNSFPANGGTLNDGANIAVGTSSGTKIGTAADQKLGFFGATPVVQQTTTSQTPATFVANSSGIANDTATWDGYTIGDVVKILRVLGFLQ